MTHENALSDHQTEDELDNYNSIWANMVCHSLGD
jgi:hypothetical protein